MKKMIAIFCCAIMLTMPAMADDIRGNGTGPVVPGSGNAQSNPGGYDLEYCKTHQSECRGESKTHAKKNSNTTTIIVASVAVGAVFAGAMWYFFKKTPSENNPGQVKLASF